MKFTKGKITPDLNFSANMRLFQHVGSCSGLHFTNNKQYLIKTSVLVKKNTCFYFVKIKDQNTRVTLS